MAIRLGPTWRPGWTPIVCRNGLPGSPYLQLQNTEGGMFNFPNMLLVSPLLNFFVLLVASCNESVAIVWDKRVENSNVGNWRSPSLASQTLLPTRVHPVGRVWSPVHTLLVIFPMIPGVLYFHVYCYRELWFFYTSIICSRINQMFARSWLAL